MKLEPSLQQIRGHLGSTGHAVRRIHLLRTQGLPLYVAFKSRARISALLLATQNTVQPWVQGLVFWA